MAAITPKNKATKTALTVSTWAFWHAVMRIEEFLYDYVLYPFMLTTGGLMAATWYANTFNPELQVTESLGYWVGFILLFLGSIATNILYLKLYDGVKKDILAFEALKDTVHNTEQKGFFKRMLQKHAEAKWFVKWAVFVYLSVWENPFFTVLFMRKEARSYKMNQYDWTVFTISILTANLVWAGVVTGVVELVQFLLEKYQPIQLILSLFN